MRRNDFREAATDLLNKHGAQHKIDGDEIVWWFEEENKVRTRIPLHGGDFRAVDNFRAKLKQRVEEVMPIYFALQSQTKEEKDKWMSYLDKRLHEIETKFEARFEMIKGDMNTATDIALDASLKIDGIAKAFQGVTQSPIVRTVTSQPSAQPAPPKSIQVLKEAETVEQPKKGLSSEMKKLNARALIAAKNSKLTPEMRVLRFLDELNEDASVEDMKRAGLVGDDGNPRSLEALLIEMDIERGLLVFDGHRDTYDLSEKAEDLLNEADEVAHQAKYEPVSHLSAFDEGLNETVMPAPYSGPPVFLAEAPKPTLTVVPKPPRILAPVPTPALEKRLSIRDKIMLHLSEHGPKTLGELKAAGLEGYGEQNSLASPMCKAKDDGLVANDSRGGRWYLTKKGEKWAERLLPNKAKNPVHNGDLRRQFLK